MENKIILTTKGNISAEDKKALRESGVVIAELGDINAVKIISGADYFEMDDIALSALETIKAYNSDVPRSEFAAKLLAKVLKVKQPITPPKAS